MGLSGFPPSRKIQAFLRKNFLWSIKFTLVDSFQRINTVNNLFGATAVRESPSRLIQSGAGEFPLKSPVLPASQPVPRFVIPVESCAAEDKPGSSRVLNELIWQGFESRPAVTGGPKVTVFSNSNTVWEAGIQMILFFHTPICTIIDLAAFYL